MNCSNTRPPSRIRELSADEEARRLAFVRERALRDEVSFINDAERRGRREGRREGRQEGHIEGLTEGRMEAMRETARNLIAMNILSDAQIAQASGLTEVEGKAIRETAGGRCGVLAAGDGGRVGARRGMVGEGRAKGAGFAAGTGPG
jgi:hypothetical protein